MWIGLEDFEPKKENVGFIYLITNKVTGMKYLGCKQYWSRITDPRKTSPTYGKKITKESKWREYQSSNKEVQSWAQEDIEKKMICQCYSKFELSYREVEALIKTQALLRDDFLNFMLGSNTIGRPSEFMLIKKLP